MSARRQLALLATPPVGYLLGTSLFARLPNAMTGLSLALMVSSAGSYRRAGEVVGAYTLGAALAAPAMGRALDRFGRTRVLRPAALADAAALIALSQLALDQPWLLVVVAVVAGLLSPPMNAASRSLWPTLVHGDSQAAIYAMDATFQELIYMVGPLLVAVAVALAGARAAVALTGVITAVGTLAFAAHPALRGLGGRGSAPHGSRWWQVPLPLAALGTAVAVVAGFAMVELATVAFCRERHVPAAAGAVLVAWSFGSLCAGLGWGMRAGAAVRPARRLAGLVIVLGAVTALPALAGNIPELVGCLFVSGLAIAPAFALLYGFVAAQAHPGRSSEAFGWLSTGFLIGAAAGAGLGGVLVQSGGPRLGYLVAGGLAACAAPALAWHEWGPAGQLRRRGPAGELGGRAQAR